MANTQYGLLPGCISGLYTIVSKRYLQSFAMRERMRAAYLCIVRDNVVQFLVLNIKHTLFE